MGTNVGGELLMQRRSELELAEEESVGVSLNKELCKLYWGE